MEYATSDNELHRRLRAYLFGGSPFVRPKGEWGAYLILLLTAALVVSLKLYYRSAGAEELRWLLYPTTLLVKAFTSLDFVFIADKGYRAVDEAIVIGPGCAGLNFYVITLCMSTFAFIGRFSTHRFYWFAFSLLISYGVTLCVNAFRIVAAIMLLQLGERLHLPFTSLLHSAQGTLFYFVFLIGYFLLLRTLLWRRGAA